VPVPIPALSGQAKRTQVRRIFASIAPRYDLVNRLMSFGQDRAWRRLAVASLGCDPGSLVLDLGTGTGEMILELRRSRCRAIGVDLSLRMLERGKAKAGSAGTFVCGDALQLPFAAGSFDGLVSAFVLRNLEDVGLALTEMRRVLKRGGRLAILEIIWPDGRLMRPLFAFYFGRVVPLLGAALTGDPVAYRYLPASVRAFMRAGELAQAVAEAGFAETHWRPLALGSVLLLTATAREARGMPPLEG
jgi:demethylmenaquinone methyltransferase/2-methoxy-6-polyprenyl-1,4-benzoquinol methylase